MILKGTASEHQHHFCASIFVNPVSAFSETLLAWLCNHCIAGYTLQCDVTWENSRSHHHKDRGKIQHPQSFKVKPVMLWHRAKWTTQTLKSGSWCLVTTAGFAGACSPINDDEAEAHCHKQEAYPSKAGSLEGRKTGWDHGMKAASISHVILIL